MRLPPPHGAEHADHADTVQKYDVHGLVLQFCSVASGPEGQGAPSVELQVAFLLAVPPPHVALQIDQGEYSHCAAEQDDALLKEK